MIPVLTLDTNILVSAAISASGNEAIVVEGIVAGMFRLAVSSAVEAEYRLVLSRPKFDRVRPRIDTVLSALLHHVRHVEAPSTGFVSPDPSDTPFIDCAVAAGADFLVTGNRRHFPRQFYAGTEVVTARQLLDRLPSAAP